MDTIQSRLSAMSDDELKSVWEAIWYVPEHDPMRLIDVPDIDEEWAADVYSEMSARGISALKGR